MSKIRVAVLRGGPSSEYDVSLKTGQTVLRQLPEKYEPKDIFIAKDGLWHQDGLVKTPAQILNTVDVVFNALHGEYGEDGKIQKLLDDHRIPYSGSRSLASAIAMNKRLTKEMAEDVGINTPPYFTVRADDDPHEIAGRVFRSFAPPYVVKPVGLGSSVGVTIVKTARDLPGVIAATLALAAELLIEEFIMGAEATVGVVDHFRGEDVYALLPIEIVPPKANGFYDYHAKYQSNDTQYLIPGRFTSGHKNEIQDLARRIHSLLNLRHYSRSDFIVSPTRGVYFIEVNTLPGMTDHSLVPKSLDAVGCPLPVFLDHVLTLALEGK